MIEPESSSGIVAETWPSTRSGSGVPKTSSVGMFGEWRRPSTVSRSPAAQCADGKRPIVRSVPGPWRRSASKRRSVRRCAFAFSSVERSIHAAAGSSVVEPADVRDVLPELLVRRLAARGPGRRARPTSGVGTGTMFQLVVMRFTTSPVSGRYGRRSRPARAGSSPSSARGACGPESEMRAACSSER